MAYLRYVGDCMTQLFWEGLYLIIVTFFLFSFPLAHLVATFYVAVMVPFNAAFAKTDKVTMASDVVVEALFIVGKYRYF